MRGGRLLGPGTNRTNRNVSAITQVVTTSIAQTIRTGERLAAGLQAGDVVLLKGDLGAGKTHFVKGVARYFGVPEEEVQSPTFSIIHEYPGRIPLYHVDAYRLDRPEEALEFGIDEYLYGDGICLIEWPGKIATLLPESSLLVEMVHIAQSKRQITIHTKG